MHYKGSETLANRIKGITIELGGDTTKLDKALQGVNKNIRNTQSQLKDVEKLLKLDPKNTELLAQKQRLLTDAITQTKDKLATLKEAAENANKALANGEITQDQYDAIQREIVETENSLKGLEIELNNTGESSTGMAQKMGAVGDAMQEVGKKMMAVSAAIAAVGAAAIKSAKELDEGYDTIITKTGASGEALEEMKSIADELFGELPVEMSNVGSAVGEVNTRFGLTGKNLKEVSKSFLQFAEINGTDVSTAIDSVQKSMSAYGISAEKTGEVLDALNYVGQATGVSVDKLAQGLVQNATSFKELGLNIQQSSMLMGQLEKSGANSETVMNGLRKALKSATKDGVPFNQALKDLEETIKGNKNGVDGLQASYDLFGKSGDQIYNAIKTGTVSFTDLANATNDVNNATGSVNNTFMATQDAWDDAKVSINQLKVSGNELAQTLLTMLKPVIDSVVSAVQRFTSWFNNLDDGTKKTIVIIGGLVASIGPLLIIVGKVISLVSTISAALPALTALISGPILPIAAVVAAIGVLAYTIYKHWDKIKQIPENVKMIFTNLKVVVNGKINELKTTIATKFNEIVTNAKNWGRDMLQGFINGITEKIGALRDKVLGVANTITSYLHFSRPDVGPLHEYEKWMPDFIDGMAKGIEKNKYKLTDALKGMSAEMTVSPSYSMNRRLDGISSMLANGNTIVLDTGELVGATAYKYNNALGNIARLEAY